MYMYISADCCNYCCASVFLCFQFKHITFCTITLLFSSHETQIFNFYINSDKSPKHQQQQQHMSLIIKKSTVDCGENQSAQFGSERLVVRQGAIGYTPHGPIRDFPVLVMGSNAICQLARETALISVETCPTGLMHQNLTKFPRLLPFKNIGFIRKKIYMLCTCRFMSQTFAFLFMFGSACMIINCNVSKVISIQEYRLHS